MFQGLADLRRIEAIELAVLVPELQLPRRRRSIQRRFDGVHAVQRYTNPDGNVGFEFQALEPDAAVEIGVLIDKYFNAARAAK